ncbi:MAG: hypothetical protein BME94_08575 [Methanobacteriales archaeon Met13]
MDQHKQVEIAIEDDFCIEVDEGLEEVIKNFFSWEIGTCNCCIDYKGSTWIEFCDFEQWEQFLQLVLRHHIAAGSQDTLWDFLQEKADVKLVFDEELREDPNQELVGTGVLVICVGLFFPRDELEEFKKLFFEVFPAG